MNTMSSLSNDAVSVEDGKDCDDDFTDEANDDSEIVSLLEDDRTLSATEIGSITRRGQMNEDNGQSARFMGVFCIVTMVVLLATILLSASSSLVKTTTPSIIANLESGVGNGDKNSTQASQPPPSPALTSNTTRIPSLAPSPHVKSDASHNIGIESSDEKAIDPLRSSPKNLNIEAATIPKIEDHGMKEDSTIWFKLHTGNARIDNAYRLAMDEFNQNIKNDIDGSPYFVPGAGSDHLLTRDTAFAIELAGGLIDPEVSRRSLELCTANALFLTKNFKANLTFWHQDISNHFGGWPNLSDAIAGARGAWHLYLYTGNSTFLEWTYEITVRSLLRAENEVLIDKGDIFFKEGLFGGSSFMESNSGYPKEYKDNGELVGKTKALSTNILYYSAYHYAYKMGRILMENNVMVNNLKDRSKALKKTIRDRLWIEKKGFYAYFENEDERLVEQTEGLGVALAMLSEDFESEHRIKVMFEKVHRTDLGIPSLWPRFDLGTDEFTTEDENHIEERYHNGRIWPFISSLWAIAAARYGQPNSFAEEFAHLIDLSEQQGTFAQFYELDKSFPSNRKRQLLSDAGYLGMVYKGLFGLNFQTSFLEFSPNKVEGKNSVLKMDETISLLNVKYRKATLDIYVTGFGTNVTSFKLNGEIQKYPRMDAYVSGRQLIEIEVAQSIS